MKKDAHGNTEVLVVTNRHVVDLGDRATMELADGTSLGPAEIVYARPGLRPRGAQAGDEAAAPKTAASRSRSSPRKISRP